MEKRGRYLLTALLIFGITLGFSFIWYLQTDDVPGGNTLPAYAAAATATPTPPPQTVVTSLTVEYSGEKQLVGTLLDPSLFTVTATFGDGAVREVDDFTFVPNRVLGIGENKITFAYNGKTENIIIDGIIVTGIEAALARTEFTIGNAADASDLTVIAIYSDGSTEEITSGYSISPTIFTSTGEQKLTVTYKSRTFSIPVTVNAFLPITSISAEYTGSGVYTSLPVDKNDISVYATYNDGSTERITTFTLTPPVFTETGAKDLTVSFRGKTATVKVLVTQLSVKSVRAKYDGGNVTVGREYDTEKLHVYATYNNDREYEVTDYTVSTLTANNVGENVIKVFVGGVEGRFTVTGVEKSEETFIGECSYEIKSDKYVIYVETSADEPLREGDVLVELVKRAKIRKAFGKLKSKDAVCIGFDYNFSDVDLENLLPVTIRVTLPDELPADYADLYFTPDLKSIVAKMNRTVIDEHTVDFLIFNTGTYMLVNDPEAYKEETADGEEDADEPQGSATPGKKPSGTPTPTP